MIKQELEQINLNEQIAAFVGLITILILLITVFDLGFLIGKNIL